MTPEKPQHDYKVIKNNKAKEPNPQPQPEPETIFIEEPEAVSPEAEPTSFADLGIEPGSVANTKLERIDFLTPLSKEGRKLAELKLDRPLAKDSFIVNITAKDKSRVPRRGILEFSAMQQLVAKKAENQLTIQNPAKVNPESQPKQKTAKELFAEQSEIFQQVIHAKPEDRIKLMDRAQELGRQILTASQRELAEGLKKNQQDSAKRLREITEHYRIEKETLGITPRDDAQFKKTLDALDPFTKRPSS